MAPAKKEDARKSFAKRLSECAGDPDKLLALGKSCFLSERYAEAIEAYRKCLSLDSRNEAAHYNLGVAYQALGKYLDARASFLKALEINPNHEAAQHALSSLAAY